MKMILLIICLLPITAFCQNKIDGIGPFRIGKTTANIVNQISDDKRIKIKESHSALDEYRVDGAFYKKTKNIFIVSEPKPGDIDNANYLHVLDYKCYFIDYYEISGVPVSKMYLYFFKDTLYSIKCDGGVDLDEALTIKYGEPEIKTETKKVKCSSRLAGEFEVEERNHTSRWDTGIDSIKAISYTSMYYNSKCEKSYFSVFHITNEELSSRLSSMEVAYRANKKSQQNTEKKKSLSDF
jgi:hypothetical protein